ncbi:MAG: DUF4062 domain-containing protein [Bacteroidota bacterium]|nr:DUF4062 domain-containing protein [Bacteroidota bacterium]
MITNYELIVSFSSSDNFSVNSGKGWVFQFRQYLEAILIRVCGYEPKIIFHTEDVYLDASHYHENTLILMIISPDYLKSGLYEKEIQKIIKFSNSEASEKIFKILKYPFEEIMLPEAIRHLMPYQFYKNNTIKYHPQEEWHQDLCLKIWDLTFDIQKKIEEKDLKGLNKISNNQIKRVYLAHTGKDLDVHREIIYRELVRQHIEVRPASVLPKEIQDLELSIRKDMEECELSIHLIGEDYGDIPNGAIRSIVEIQNKLAVELAAIHSGLT